MEDLDRLQTAHPKDLVVVAISDEELRIVERHLASTRWRFTSGFVTDVGRAPEVVRAMQTMRPLSLVIDRGGTIRDWLGPATYAEFDAVARRHL